MSAKIDKSAKAQIDLIEQAEYIEADSLDAAIRFLEAAERDFAFLATMPGAGAKREYRARNWRTCVAGPLGDSRTI